MGSSKPQPQTTTQQTTSEPWAAQQPHLKSIFGEAERLYNDPNTPQFYPGQTFADPSQSTLQGLAGTEARAQYGSPVLGAAQNEATKTLGGDYLNPGANPYVKGIVDSTMAEVIPRISGGFSGAGGAGGLQARAAGLGATDAVGKIYGGIYENERNRMMGAMNSAPQLASADYLDPQMMMQAGAQREAIAQKPIDEAMGRFNYEQNLPQAKLADYMQMVQGSFGGTSNTTGTQYIPQQNPWMQALGGVLGLAGTAGGLGWKPFSDERLKEDIKRVGKTDDGLDIFTYRYKWGGPPMMGVMAQDLLEKKPEAVTVQPLNGRPFYAVDYAQVS